MYLKRRTSRGWLWVSTAVTLLLACARQPAPTEIRVFAAVSTADPLESLGRDYEKETGQKVTFAFGASNDLARQLKQGAKADIFLSADVSSMETLTAGGGPLAPMDVQPLLTNTLVVFTSDAQDAASSLNDALEAKQLALADPVSVPAGRYAKAWLEKKSLWSHVAPRVVPCLDVRAVVAAVRSGAAPVGIAYRTEVARASGVRVVYAIPREEGPDIVYPVALLADASEAGRRFFTRLRGPAAKEAFEKGGFGFLPTSAAARP